MKNELVRIITEQTEILLANLKSQVEGATLEAIVDNVNNSRFLFHALHSLDKYFINPYQYEYKADVTDITENLSVISEHRAGYAEAPGVVIAREQLLAYFDFVQKKIFDYLHGLSDEMLCECPANCPHTRLALILGQYRHLMFHLGMSEQVTFSAAGTWLDYTGLPHVEQHSRSA